MNWRQPWLAGFMAERRLCTILVIASGVLALGTRFGIPLWICPFRAVTSLPCPGCGLTRAASALASGQWSAALAYHPFIPIFALAWILLFLSVVLPASPRQRLIGAVRSLECRTGITVILLIIFAAYGLTRTAKTCFSQSRAEIPKVFQRTSEPELKINRNL